MIDNDILENFGRIWPRHVLHLTRFLIACRQNFEGDIDLFLVLCVIGERSFSHAKVRTDLKYDEWNAQTSILVEPEDINVQSIADFSGIPRETVRRKLRILLEKGWVERDAQGYVRAAMKAKTDLEPLTLASLQYLSQMKSVLKDG